MPDPLFGCRAALEKALGRPPFVLPPPYKRGHFRTQLIDEALWPLENMQVKRDGDCLYLSLRDEALLRLAREAAGEESPLPEPSLGAGHTLLYQILIKRAVKDPKPLEEERRFLLRLCLDLFARGERGGWLKEALRSLNGAFARDLCEGSIRESTRLCAAMLTTLPPFARREER